MGKYPQMHSVDAPMPLSDAQIRALKPSVKATRHFDAGGLYLEVSPAGGKLWRLKYRVDGSEKRLALGKYPDVSLKDAREKRDEARQLLAKGIDPSTHRKAARASREATATSFEVIAREWFERMSPTWAPSHGVRLIRRLEREIFPWLGNAPIADINAPDVLACLRRIEARGHIESAHRVGQIVGQVFRYGVATGRCLRDPTGDLKGALPPVRVEHMPAITEPSELGALLRTLDAFTGTAVVGTALRLLPHLFVRPGELRAMRWDQLHLEAGEWRFVASKTKQEHIVPLSRQAVAMLRELQPVTGHNELVFPGTRKHDKPISEVTLNAALQRMGYCTRTEVTGHGFRATARTLLHEVLRFEPAVIEHQLAHRVPDALGRAYNRTKFLDERRSMMQRWSDYLDELKAG